MNSSEFASQLLTQIQSCNDAFVAPALNEKQKRNAGKVMQEIIAHRLQSDGQQLDRQKGSRFRWGEGIILVRNSRVANGFWSNMLVSQIDDIRKLSQETPTVFLFSHFDQDQCQVHVWAIPDEIAIKAFDAIRENESGFKTIFIELSKHQIKDAAESPNLEEYYRCIDMTELEADALVAGVKQDVAAKELAAATEEDEDDTDGDDVATELYSQETVDFMLELPEHTSDGSWHEANKQRYVRVLRDPTDALVEELRNKYIQSLDPEVARTKRNHSVLKKNDYGQGGYHDHYWAAFYDPAAKSKTKSCQLFFRLLGRQQQFRFGFAFGNYCEEYLSNLHRAFADNLAAVKEYLDSAPAGTRVRVDATDDDFGQEASEFASILGETDAESGELRLSAKASIDIVRVFSLVELPAHADTLVAEIGSLFEWVWPFFEASRTGTWTTPSPDTVESLDEKSDDAEQLDEDAPQSLQELGTLSALPISKLQEIEDALLTKQQVILTGPPGTSKTYIAQLFARYFVAQQSGQAQGNRSTLFMHANWAYEDFFEGIKPFTRDGNLQFEPKLGYFLEWIHSLQSYDSSARHVLVLDEINRCDTAAVLGELLQLLEYRGRDVRLLSGRTFSFPRNVYIIGTMNSADRSIGRMDLALRRRFLWLDLVPDYSILKTWLARTGNNPARFSADSLRQCNQLLEDRGIPSEQQIGHALFMVQTFGSETQEPKDKPLIPQALQRIVRFSVLPYVRELCLIQLGRTDNDLVGRIEEVLLACVSGDSEESGDWAAASGDEQ